MRGKLKNTVKKRILQILSMKDRIAVFAIMNVVDRHLQKRYIRTTGASIKRRGTHDLMNCIRTDLQKKSGRHALRIQI